VLTHCSGVAVVCSLKVTSEMEVDFARCIQFLSSMISKVTLRGSFPHCTLIMDRNTYSVIGCWHHNVVRTSIRLSTSLSVCLYCGAQSRWGGW